MQRPHVLTLPRLTLAGLLLASAALAEMAADLPDTGVNLPLRADVSDGASVRFDYLVVRQDARALFGVLARDMGLRLDMSDRVRGTIAEFRLSGTRDEVLATAAEQLGLDWFAFNGALYVSDRSEALIRIVRLGDLKPEKVIAVLRNSGLPADRLNIEPAAEGTALALSGPPKLLALAEAIIEGIPPAPKERAAEAAARIVTIRRANEAEKVQLP